ncbi:MAG: ATP-grasp domain-containing protein [Mediterranea massiliensis]|nr:ATP-grasp domain-containing protein [Mediterranea massiliensis]
MAKQKILLLGGSAQQLVAIRAAKELGFYTVLCDYLPDNPGQYEADVFYQVSTTDVDAIYEVAKKEKVDGILAYASDPAALPAAIVCERLGLRTNPAKSVEILGLKHPWREFLKNNGFACPKAATFSPTIKVDELKDLVQEFKFPIVIKPTDSSGSKGVTVLNGLDDIATAIDWADSYSRNKVLIVEEFISRGFPYVIGGDIFVWNGKIVLYGEMTCLRDLENSPLIPIGKKKPCGLNNNQIERVHAELQRVIDTLGICFGQMNIEILLDTEDNVHFLELGPRAGGNMIPVQLSDAFGIDLIRANVQVAMGIKPDFLNEPVVAKDGCFMHYVLHSYKDGTFKGININQEIANFVYRQVIYKQEGDVVEKFDGAGKAIGIIFLHFDTVEQMDYFCEHHNELIKINLA